eukprot:TRINITY_DN4254_c0_g1_i1.p1 TRINITY_DN4254_c0_g1~~TRINITY_DN4254_c0_g1_i1.p1  ORF type:complete len:316 (-),score=82.40 TRINITY_DN4254_c0_g1_i1:525-1472(-)
MCALKPPFDARNITALTRKIIAGSYSPLPPQYSKDLRLLVASMLSTDPMKRPNIQKVLRYPFVQSRIQTFMSQTRYNMKFTDSINKKALQETSEHARVQNYYDKVREKPRHAHEQKEPQNKGKVKSTAQKKEPEKKVTKTAVKEQPAPTKVPEQKHHKKWEEDRKKMRADIEKSKRKNKGTKHEIDIRFVETTSANVSEVKTEKHREEPHQAVKSNPAPKRQFHAAEKPPVSVEKKCAGGIREEIMRRRQQSKGFKSALDNFSEEDVLVNGVQVKQQIEELTKSIAKNLKLQPREEEHQEDIRNMVTEMESVTSP